MTISTQQKIALDKYCAERHNRLLSFKEFLKATSLDGNPTVGQFPLGNTRKRPPTTRERS
jgi:hypothetical protein